MTYEEFLSRLEGVHRSGNQASAKCPAHEDKTASLSVSTGEGGKILLNCHAGCTSREIAEAMGLSLNDLFPSSTEKSGKRELVAQYDYLDGSGRFLYRKTRWRMPDGGKSFTWSHKESGGWKSGRGGEPVLYNLPALKGASQVYLVEGEKDVETLKAHGLTATSPPDGAASKWKPQYTEALKGKAVVILEDNDEPGHKFAYAAACALHGSASSVKIIDLTREWDKLKAHGDISDVLEDHPAEDVFWALDALELQTPEFEPSDDVFGRSEAPPRKLSTISAVELQQKEFSPLRCVVVDLLPQGLSILASPPKYGKSWFVLDLCLSVAAGNQFLSHDTVKTGCLYLALEDSERRLKNRMNDILNGGMAPEGFDFSTAALDIGAGLIESLNNYLKEHPGTGLIVIDTLQKVRPASNGKENAYSADYREIGILKKFADQNNLCLVLVHHLRKMGDDDPFNRISGTNGIMGAADTMFVMTRKRRSDNTTLSIVGRDIESQELMMEFRTEEHRWNLLGNVDWLEEQHAKNEYDDSPIVETIKKLLEQSPGHRWSGTMQDLFDAGKHFAGTYLAENARGLTSKVKALEKSLFEYDGIIHERVKNGASGGSKHHFYLKYSAEADFGTTGDASEPTGYEQTDLNP